MAIEMEKEKEYANEKAFYKGKDYDLKSHPLETQTTSPMSPSLESDDDFDMSEGLYQIN